MKPFEGNCQLPEVKKEHVVTIGLNRDGNKKVASVMVANGSVENPVPSNTGIYLIMLISVSTFGESGIVHTVLSDSKDGFCVPESSSSSLDIGAAKNFQRLKRLNQGLKTVNTEPKRPKPQMP